MLTLEMIRTRCRELLAQAESEGNERNIWRFQGLSKALQEDDCFTNHEKRKMIQFPFLYWMDFPREEKEEFFRHIEEASRFPGILHCPDGNGKTVPVKAILEPSVEYYCQFSNGTICKIREETNFYYLNRDGRWVYDGSLQRWFEDAQYSYETLRYTLLPKATEEQEKNK